MIAEMLETKSLGDVCEIITKGTTPTSIGHAFQREGINFVKVESITENGEFIKTKFAHISDEGHEALKRSQLKENDILFSIAGALGRTAIVTREILPANTNQALAIIRLKDEVELEHKYLIKFLISAVIADQIEKLKGGVAQQNLSLSQLKGIAIPIPPLPEQERIVAKLDKAFAAIDQAKANVQRNLQNAKELFQSKLNAVFSNKGDGWVEKPLSECIRLKSGDGLTAKNMKDGNYPVYGGNGIAGHHETFNLEGSNVIIGRVGALCGNARHVNEAIWLTDNAFKVSAFIAEFDHGFLTELLNYCDLRSYARQAAQPVVSNSSMKDVPLVFPHSLSEQGRLVKHFHALRAVLEQLETKYSQRLTELEDLKKSLLERAFKGEL